jgi:periplasmic protein TonB
MKKQVLLLAILMAIALKSSFIFAQELTKADQDTNIGKEVFTIVQEMPTYPGGQNAMEQFLALNIQYPPKAKENNIQGTVYAGFIVEADGTLSTYKVIKGIGAGCDEEVLRVLKSMPKWNSGKQAGKAVRVRLTIPVKFKVEK